MKKTLYFFAAAAILLQACSTGKSFSKKRYSHLKWIDHNTEVEIPGKDSKAAPATDNTIRFEQAEATLPVLEKKQDMPLGQPAVNNTLPPAQPVRQSSPARQPVVSQVKEESVNEVKNVNKTPETIVGKKESKATISAPKPLMDDDAKLIICVILAIIIPPLGMYLWDQQADSWFIIDLILFLCLFLFVFGPFGFLWLASVVIALLRVFGMI